MHFFYIKQQLQAEVWGEVNDLVYSICKHSKYLMELQNKIVQDGFIMLPLPLLHMHAKRSPIYSTDSEHTYNWAMVYSAEVLKARSGIRNSVAISMYYGVKLTGPFQNTASQPDRTL